MNAAGVPSLLLENARQRVRGRLQDEAAGVPHIVNGGILSGEDTRVRRRRQRRLRYRVLEKDAALCEAIERRSFDIRVSVAAQMIGAKRVHGDHHHIERTQPWNPVLSSGAGAGLEWQPARRTMPARYSRRGRGLAKTIWFSI